MKRAALAALGLLFVGNLAAAKEGARLSELNWLAPSADAAAALTATPGECLAAPKDGIGAFDIELGRVAFRSPFLFGGQAARAGLSCNSCHRDGQGNPDFFYPEFSGAPGTADVTSALFSASREDHLKNPAPIPSLVGISEKSSFGTVRPTGSLEAFIRGAVEEEFHGAPLDGEISRALVAYVSALRADACPEDAAPQSPERGLSDAVRALAIAREALSRSERNAADFAVLAAQAEIGRVHERFTQGRADRAAKRLEARARAVGRLRDLLNDEPRALAAISREQDAIQSLAKQIAPLKARSLYDRRRIRAYLARGKGEKSP